MITTLVNLSNIVYNEQTRTWPSIGPKGGPAAAIPAGILVLNLEEWSILSATFFIDFNRATDLDMVTNGNCDTFETQFLLFLFSYPISHKIEQTIEKEKQTY